MAVIPLRNLGGRLRMARSLSAYDRRMIMGVELPCARQMKDGMELSSLYEKHMMESGFCVCLAEQARFNHKLKQRLFIAERIR